MTETITITPGQAFKDFYRAEFPKLVRFLCWKGANHEQASDVAQDAFAITLKRWDEIVAPQAFIRKIAGNALVKKQKKLRADILREQKYEALVSAASMPYYAQFSIGDEEKCVMETIATLPKRQRDVMAWFLDGYGPSEISEVLNIPSEAVRSNLYQARKRLKQQLIDLVDETDSGASHA